MTELAAALLRDWSLALSVANSILKNFDRAQEAVQESVYRALLNADSYDPQRPVRPWFLRIVRNVSLSEIKRASRLVAMPELLDDNSPIDTTLRQERTQEIRGAVAALSRSYRAVLHLRYDKSYQYRDIASELCIPIGTTKILLHRAHKRLRTALTQTVR